MSACTPPAPVKTVIVEIESSPNNLDLRIGTDAQSERIGDLIFDPLVRKDEHFLLQPWLAKSWQQPDPLTWVFHLRDGVHFHDGRPLEAEDVAYTVRSLIDGTLSTAKAGNFASVDRVDTPDRLTVVVHLKHPDEGLLFNLSDGLFGVVPRGSGKDLGQHPIGSGPFRFVSAEQDKDVLLERNPASWSTPARIERVDFRVVPDAITAALELRKAAASGVPMAASNFLTLDMIHALSAEPRLQVASGPASTVVYMNFNVTDPTLRDAPVRQAIALSIDKAPIIAAIWRGQARPADTLLPAGHWAAIDTSDPQLATYPHDPARAAALLQQAGFPADARGVRVHLVLKTSTDETTRQLAAVLQQQMRAAGIELTLRSAEFGTFYSDVTKGAFQIYCLRWIGANEDPDIFHYAYGSDRFPPRGANRGRYHSAELDAALSAANATTDEATRRADYLTVQRILSHDLPGIPLWYPNNEIVSTDTLKDVQTRISGNFYFLTDASIR